MVSVLVVACTPTLGVPSPSPTAVPTIATALPSPLVLSTPTPAPSGTRAVARTPRVGGCTSATATSRQLLDRYFSLTTSGDVAAVLDCFAKVYRDIGDMEFSANRWANAGPLSSLSIRYVDTMKGCDRFATDYQFVTPDPGWPNGFTIFLSVGQESGVMRIFDGGTGLASAEATRVVCQ